MRTLLNSSAQIINWLGFAAITDEYGFAGGGATALYEVSLFMPWIRDYQFFCCICFILSQKMEVEDHFPAQRYFGHRVFKYCTVCIARITLAKARFYC